MHISRQFIAFVIILQILFWGTFVGFARTSFTWTGGTGSWHEASNWSPSGVPGAGDDALIQSGFVSLGGTDVEIANLTFSTGIIYAEGATLTVTSTLTWSGGELMGDSTQTSVIDTLEIPANATADIRGSGIKTLNRWAFMNLGSATWQDQGVIRFTNRSVLENGENASFSILNDRTMSFIAPDGGTFKNSGTLSKDAGSSQSFISVHFENKGTVNANTGTIQIDLTSSSTTSDFNSISGTLVEFRNGPHELDSVTYSGGGMMEISDAQLNLAGDGLTIASGASLLMTGSGSLINGSGDLTIDGTFDWNRAEISGSGTFTVNNILNIGGNSPKTLGRDLNNLNTINWSGSGALRVTDNAHIQNQVNSVINFQDDALMDFFDTSGGTFTNLGTVNKTGGSTFSTIDLAFANQGIVNINASGLKLTKSITDETGIYNIAGNSELILDADAHEFTGNASISGAGKLTSTGGNTTISGTYDGTGEINIEGGVFSFNSPDTITNITQSGGVLGGTGELTINGTYNWSDGSLVGTAGVLLKGTTNITGTLSELKLIDGQTVTNSGTINYSGLADIRLGNDAKIINDASGVFNIRTNADIAKDFNSPTGGSITNDGLFSKNSGSETTTIEADFQNNGTLDASSGTLNFNRNLISAVDAIIQGSDTLNVTNAAFSNSGRVNPGTSPGILTITGDYSQNASSVINIEINGVNPGSGYDRLNVANSAVSLAGTLEFTIPDNYRPEVTDVFEVITYENRSGQLTSINGPQGATFTTEYTNSALTITDIIMPNRPPLASGNELTTDEDIEKTVEVLSNDSDPDNDPISIFSFDQAVHGTVTQVGDDSFNYAPDANFFGADSFDYIIEDNEGARDTARVLITVNPINDAPVVSGIPDVSFVEDNSNTLDLDPFGGDIDNTTDELDWTATVLSAQPPVNKNDDDKLRIDPSDLNVTIDPVTHIATFEATGDTAGIFTVEFTATDPSEASDTDTITVSVSPVLDPPVLVNPISDISYSEDGGPITIGANLNTVFQNAEPVAMSFSAETDNPDITAVIQGNFVSVNSSAHYFGTGSVIVTANNGSSTTASDTFVVTINSINDAPNVDMPDVTFAENSDTTIDLDNYVSDPDHNDAALNWTANVLSVEPAGFDKSGNASSKADITDLQISIDPVSHVASFTATTDSSGIFTVEFIASDPLDAAGKDTVLVTVSRILDPPQLTNPFENFSFTEDSGPVMITANLLNHFSNPEPDLPMSYTVLSDNENIMPSVSNNTLSVTSSTDYFGSGNVTITASNGAEETASDVFLVTVNPFNDAPNAFLPDITFSENRSFTLNLDLFVSDVDNDTSAMTWSATVISVQDIETKTGSGTSVGPEDLQVSIDPVTRDAVFSASQDSIGIFTVVFTVTDPGELSDLDTMLVTVSDVFVNTPPSVVAPIPDATYSEDEGARVPAADLNLVFFDPDPDQVLGFTVASGNANILASIDNDALIVEAAENFWGSGDVIVTATDDSSAAVSDTFLVTILPVNDPPELVAFPEAVSIPEDGSLMVDLDTLVTDIDDAIETLSWAVGFVDTLQSDKNITITFDPSTNIVTLTPDSNYTIIGAQFEITVCDTSLACDQDTAIINIIPVNDPPVFSGLPDTLIFEADSTVDLNIWNYISDVESSPAEIGFNFESESDSVFVSYNPGSGEVMISAHPQFMGTTKIHITATDPDDGMAADSITAIVNPVVGIGEPLSGEIPAAFALLQNYPNPFNPSTEIQFHLPSAATVELTVYNMLGQKVRRLVNEKLSAGIYQATWDGRNDSGISSATGVYIYRISASGTSNGERVLFNEVRKMILIK